MLMIRLARRGKKKNPVYRIVVSEKARDLFGNALEVVGTYSPVSHSKEVGLNKERILYWISKGAHVSPTVHNLLVSNAVISNAKIVKKQVKQKGASAKAEETAPASALAKTEASDKPAV